MYLLGKKGVDVPLIFVSILLLITILTIILGIIELRIKAIIVGVILNLICIRRKDFHN